MAKFTKGSLSFSMIVGTLLVPLSAVAALWLTDPTPEAEAAVPSTTTQPSTTTSTVAATVVTVGGPDLRAACGPDGMELVGLEDQGTISDVQQAALDALRELCEQQGMPLPAKPASEPIVQTVVVPAPAVTPSTSSSTTTTYDDHDDDVYEGEYDDDEGHEREGEHEGEEHESEHEHGGEDD
ncbi:MAG: hypothetical protein PVF87_10385 [Acidimicrobiia bacterium]